MREVPDLNAEQRSVTRKFCRWLFNPRVMRRVLICLAAGIALIAAIYARVNTRGDRLWAECKREMAAKGETLDWADYAPLPVPDEQNIFKAPGMAVWFGDDRPIMSAPLDHPVTNEFAARMVNSNLTAQITTTMEASRFLAWSDQFAPDFDSIRGALARPYARLVADYSKPLSMQFPNVATWSWAVLILEQRANCHLLLGQPQAAWEELTLLQDLRRLLECQGRFMTPEGAWMVRGNTRHSLAVIAQGLEMHAWSEAQLLTLQYQLRDTQCITQFAGALRCGRALLVGAVESGTLFKAALGSRGMKDDAMAILLWLVPRGAVYAKCADAVRRSQEMLDSLVPASGTIRPADASKAFDWWKRAQEGLPGLLWDQTQVNEGQIACALERYRLAHGEYPEAVEALVPHFIDRLPHDIVNGEPLKYQRTAGDGFLLYSIGWNATDEGGRMASNPGRPETLKSGDWVWHASGRGQQQ